MSQNRTLRLTFPYMQGADVRDAQNRLIASGYLLPKHGADGVFGPETERSVKGFQKTNGLNIDGIVGPETWAALYAVTGGLSSSPGFPSNGGSSGYTTQTLPGVNSADMPPLIDNETRPWLLAGSAVVLGAFFLSRITR